MKASLSKKSIVDAIMGELADSDMEFMFKFGVSSHKVRFFLMARSIGILTVLHGKVHSNQKEHVIKALQAKFKEQSEMA